MNGAPDEFLVRLVVAVLATWRMTHLLAAEDGPGDLVFRLRRALGQGFLGQLADCFYCLSLFVAAPAAWFATRDPVSWVATWLAVSGAACLLERIGHQPPLGEPVVQPLEGETDVLRFKTLDDPPLAAPANPGSEPPGPAGP
jgi:hypothetical protein